MNDDADSPLHAALRRQLKRLGLDPAAPPDAAAWQQLLSRVSQTYRQGESDRYLLERSLEISSREMRQMYEELERQSSSALNKRARELKKLNQELEAARDAALQSRQTMSRFLANMSHELRTPLTAIIGYTDLLIEELDELDADMIAHDLNKIGRATRHLVQLINDLLDLSKIEAGEMRLYPERFLLDELLDELRELFTPTARDKGLHYATSAPSQVWLTQDRVRIKQILINLLSNAVKFTRQGTIHLDVSATEEQVTLTVRDTGRGMTSEELARVFRPYHQLDDSARQGMGTGLGLSITQKLAHLLGGAITVSSVLDEGSAFSLSVPRWLDDHAEEAS